MSPRGYTMTRRAAAAESTRERIVKAAIDLYRVQGVSVTTVAQVAERADVARATVLNHFGSGEGLTAAAIESIADELRLPTAAIFDGARDRADRLRRLVEAMFDLYERSEPWFSILERDVRSVAPMRRREQQFWSDMQRLYGKALGPLGRNRTVMATVAALTGPATFGAFRATGLSTAEAARIVAQLLEAGLRGREAGRRAHA